MRISITSFILALVLVAAAAADETRTLGWRGDGTGRFPDADAPVRWGRHSEALRGLTTQADRPGEDADRGARPALLGFLPEWLTLGPFEFDPDAPAAETLAREFVSGEAALRPAAGESAGGREWKKTPSQGALLNFAAGDADMKGKAFYAHAYLHSREPARLFARLIGPGCRFWVNGAEIRRQDVRGTRPEDHEIDLRRGWNRLLVKVCSFPAAEKEAGYFQVILWGRAEDPVATEGILWEASLPNAPRFSCAQPLILGDRVYVNADPSFLLCFDKRTGKRLWTRYCGQVECVTDEERKAYPQVFAALDPKVARLKALGSSWTGTRAEKVELRALATEAATLLKNVDDRKYAGVASRQEAGMAGLTSCSDGQYLYTWFADGVAVCHDLDGKRRWITLENEGRRGGTSSDRHGYQISPLLTDTELVVRMRSTLAFDKATGKVLWRTEAHRDYPPVDPSKPVPAEGSPCVVYPELGVYKPGVGLFGFSGATLEGRRAYYGRSSEAVYAWEIPERLSSTTPLVRRGPLRGHHPQQIVLPNAFLGNSFVANVLVHDGLIYSVTLAGQVRVHDEKTLDLVYAAVPELNTFKFSYPYPHGSGVCASPTLGGKYVYIFGNAGSTLVLKPGRKYEVVAMNRIERLLPGSFAWNPPDPSKEGYRPECTVSSPVFDRRRLYYQAEGALYCIGQGD
jgi:outer membrane protein assembly factor BamB